MSFKMQNKSFCTNDYLLDNKTGHLQRYDVNVNRKLC